MHTSSSYAKILWETNFHAREILRSGSKAKDGKEEKRKKERPKVGDNNGQATHGARKHAWRTQAAWAKKPVMLAIMIKRKKERKRKERETKRW